MDADGDQAKSSVNDNFDELALYLHHIFTVFAPYLHLFCTVHCVFTPYTVDQL